MNHKNIILFIALIYSLSMALNFFLPMDYQDLMMFIPGGAALFFSIINREKLVTIFKFSKMKTLTISCFIPVLAFALVLTLYKLFAVSQIGLPEEAIIYNKGSVFQAWKRFFIYGLPYMLAINSVFALGEEIGWRGFLLRKILKNSHSFLLSALIVGIVWGVWHVPMYVKSGMHLFSIIIFLLNTCLISILYTWLFKQEYSLWPTVMAHTLHNTLFNVVLATLTLSKTGPSILYGEEGIFVMIAYSIIIAVGALVLKTKIFIKRRK